MFSSGFLCWHLWSKLRVPSPIVWGECLGLAKVYPLSGLELHREVLKNMEGSFRVISAVPLDCQLGLHASTRHWRIMCSWLPGEVFAIPVCWSSDCEILLPDLHHLCQYGYSPPAFILLPQFCSQCCIDTYRQFISDRTCTYPKTSYCSHPSAWAFNQSS